MYLLLDNNQVKEIIPEIDPSFPEITIDKRYPSSFIEKLVRISDDIEVQQNWIYNPETGTVSKPVDVRPNISVVSELSGPKMSKVAASKTDLEAYLEANPMTWTDGNQYSVTEKKQNLLTSQLGLYQIAVTAGQPYTLEWNAIGEECVEWSYENLVALALSISAYVKPLISYQRVKEVEIMACETVEELDAIIINYETME